MRYPSVPIKVNLTFLQQLGMLRTRTNLLTLKQINIFHVKIFSLLYFCISHILYFYEKRCHVSKKENYNNKNIILLWPYLVSNVTGLNWKKDWVVLKRTIPTKLIFCFQLFIQLCFKCSKKWKFPKWQVCHGLGRILCGPCVLSTSHTMIAMSSGFPKLKIILCNRRQGRGKMWSLSFSARLWALSFS